MPTFRANELEMAIDDEDFQEFDSLSALSKSRLIQRLTNGLIADLGTMRDILHVTPRPPAHVEPARTYPDPVPLRDIFPDRGLNLPRHLESS